jgi:predicted unusual protein kinase regulating ubiquinone biosynthesis (AarF/ABC1/UbiB family)
VALSQLQAGQTESVRAALGEASAAASASVGDASALLERAGASLATVDATALLERVSAAANAGTLPAALADAATSVASAFADRADAATAALAAALPDTPLLSALSQQLLAASPAADAPLVVALLALAGVTVTAVPLLLGGGKGDTLPSVYDPAAIAAYYNRRPQQLLARQASLAAQATAFAAGLLADRNTGAWERNAPKRAAELRELIVRQGAAFIKVGQALAVRPDILPPAYLTEFAKLLDQVPPFEALEAKAALRAALAAKGQTPEAAFEDAGAAFAAPVAAASIGQVYKARVRGGGVVAVKLQRPNILGAVTLDLHIIRQAVLSLAALPAPLTRIAKQARSFIDVLDVAAARFVEELDYEREASNSVRFADLMAASSASRGAISVPRVYTELSSRQMLVTEWVDGVKISDIPRDTDAGREQCGRLVRVLLQFYMIQLLETGLLHADPHPGNFLLQPDGRVAIMDFGMMTEITPEQRYAFLEYMSNLSAKNYDATVEDLVNLGFVPSELSTDPAKRAIVAPAIASTLEILYGGGGGLSKEKIAALESQSRIAALSEELKAISRAYPVSLPPYFVLILRAFGTLEGLGLGIDSSFEILGECFPYVARRLLTDDSPRVRAALKTFAYGTGDRLSVERVEMIADGFKAFSATMDTAPRAALPAASSASAPSAAAAPVVDAGTMEMLSVVFSPQGNYVQALLLEEAVRAVDALSRDALLAVWRATAGAAAAPLRGAFAPAAAVLPPAAAPFLQLLAGPLAGPPLRLTAEDESTLATLRRLAVLMVPLPPAGGAPPGAASIQFDVRALVDASRALTPLLPAVAPGLAAMGQRFVRMLAQRMLQRAAEDLGASAAAIGQQAPPRAVPSPVGR